MKVDNSEAVNESSLEESPKICIESQDTPQAFNEQTHYVPVRTIITVCQVTV